MARTRSIKPGFFDNEILGDLPPLTRLLFIGLWTIADREGRLEDKPRRIKKILLGYDDVDADGVDKMLQSLHDTGFIFRYSIDGNNYIQIVNFLKHQNPHIREKASEIPPPPAELITKHHESPIHTPDLHGAGTVQATPITVNLSPSTGNLLPTTDNPPEGGDDDGEPDKQPKKSLLEQRFDEFWAAYPKKVGKKAAWSAFKKVKPDAELFDKIMTAIGRAKATWQWQRENGRYIPNPKTWLNEGRWDDEYKEANTNGEYRSIAGTNGQEPAATKPWRTGAAAPGFKLAGETDDPDNDREEE
jgi:hypothetical protein